MSYWRGLVKQNLKLTWRLQGLPASEERKSAAGAAIANIVKQYREKYTVTKYSAFYFWFYLTNVFEISTFGEVCSVRGVSKPNPPK